MRITNKIIYFIILSVCAPIFTYAQNSIRGDEVKIGGMFPELAMYQNVNTIYFQSYKGVLWHPTDNEYFKIDLSGPDTRISGSGECVNFYSPVVNNYINILVRDLLLNSDIRAKSNIANIDSVAIDRLFRFHSNGRTREPRKILHRLIYPGKMCIMALSHKKLKKYTLTSCELMQTVSKW